MSASDLSDSVLAKTLGQAVLIHRASLFSDGKRRVEAPWKLGHETAAPSAAGAIVGPGDHPDVVFELLRSDAEIPALRKRVAELHDYIAANAPSERPRPTIWILYSGAETEAVKDLMAELRALKVEFLVADL